MADAPQPSEHPLICVVPHGTGVIDDKIRIFVLGQLIAGFPQNAGDFLGILGIHLAAEGHGAGSRLSSEFPGQRRYQKFSPLYKCSLPLCLLRGGFPVKFNIGIHNTLSFRRRRRLFACSLIIQPVSGKRADDAHKDLDAPDHLVHADILIA